MPQGHPGQLLCWDRGLHHLCSKRGKCAYALSQCTQQGEAHPIYLVTCSLFWVVGGKWFSLDGAAETDIQAKRFGFHSWTLRSPEWRDRWSNGPTILKEVVFAGLSDTCFCTPQGSNFSYSTSWTVCYRRQERGSLFLIQHARNRLRFATMECTPQLLITTKQGLS